MKKVLLLLLFWLLTVGAFAQNDLFHSGKTLQPSEEFENIHVQKLSSDARASVFVIWIKSGVRKHKHAEHSETVHILKGKGTMQLGNQTLEIRKGDIIFIPEGTPHSVQVKGGTMKVISIQAPEFDGTDRIWLDQP
jgi:quercetin dioxygenase-like cupin family protein